MTPDQIREMQAHATHAQACAEARELIIAARAEIDSAVSRLSTPPRDEATVVGVLNRLRRVRHQLTTALSSLGARSRRDYGLDR